MLEGLDPDWSAWTRKTTGDYTNLGFGSYRFRVRAKNVHGQVSGEAVYAFAVLPPWYRTWWAYGRTWPCSRRASSPSIASSAGA